MQYYQYNNSCGLGRTPEPEVVKFPTVQEAGLASPKALGVFGLIATGFVVAFGLTQFFGKKSG